jgi:hypothetical protein
MTATSLTKEPDEVLEQERARTSRTPASTDISPARSNTASTTLRISGPRSKAPALSSEG